MPDVMPAASDAATLSGALVRADHPWSDADLAGLYDAFPFSGDLPFYLGLAEGRSPVLELACGSGRVLVPLAQAGCPVTGVDISPPMLRLARARLEQAGADVSARARLVQGDMRTFELPDRFELALIAVKSFAYLTTRAEQQQTLERVAAHLRPGGLLALDLLHPAPGWLAELPGSLRQDLVQPVPERGVTVARTEAVVSTDLAVQVRVIRSQYEVIADDGTVRKRIVEWPYRYTFRFEAEHLLERAGFAVQAIYGGYRREPFATDSRVMALVAQRT